MSKLNSLKVEVNRKPEETIITRNVYLSCGFMTHMDDSNVIARAYAIKSLFEEHKKHIYVSDLIAGSVRGLLEDNISEDQIKYANRLVSSFGYRHFGTNSDHYAPNYATMLQRGIGGTVAEIEKSLEVHEKDTDFQKKRDFLHAVRITMIAFSKMIEGYGDAAKEMGKQDVADACYAVMWEAPRTFRQGLQLVWIAHVSFYYEGRCAMALGRLDQYLYPFFRSDIEKGIITHSEALELMECTLYKIREAWYFGGDDVVNIVIGGVKPEDGSDAVNDLTYIILQAVGNCNIPGPNLSARLHKKISPDFIDACLRVVGTGLGYPAMMNDEVNIPALERHGYTIEECRNYCMVGCIENFIQGNQPPWSDGRYNTPKYLELALNNGVCMLTSNKIGIETGDASSFDTMDKFMAALEDQMSYGAAEYMLYFRNENNRYNPETYMQPYLSCYCDCCIERGLDINDGGALYPSVHGAGCMGIATMADSLAAIEKLVYDEKVLTLTELTNILQNNFLGYEDIRAKLLKAPKYGNNDDYVDKYAVWFVEFQNELFSKYKTRDGGDVYIAIASNVSNIPAGIEVAATPDGRGSKEPVSDAASPMHGMDKNGPTAVANSLSKPNYKLVSCGSVVNQKYSTEMFRNPEKRAKLAAMIITYFAMGGQEIQINSVSRDVLIDAMNHPDGYHDLVVRVSGFSAYYTLLSKEVQMDILKRTEHE